MAALSPALIAFLSKYYEALSLCLFALYRLLFSYAGTLNSVVAALVFPMLTLKLKNYAVKYTVILAHFDVLNLIVGHNNGDLFMWTIIGLVVLGISEYLNNKDKHVLINLIVCNLVGNLIIQIWKS